MPEGQSVQEVEPTLPLADAVTAIFERRAKHGDRELILETYKQKFQKLLETLPKENRDTTMVKIQKFFVNVNGWFSEYGARVSDFIRNVTVWPMIRADKDFPNDVYYQMELSRAKAWGDFAINTTKTATTARMAYRNNFLPSALTGSVIGAVGLGIVEGVKYGSLVGGLAGAAAGAAIGGAIGGGVSVFLRMKDRIMGPPVLYYSLNSGPVIINSASKGASSLIGGPGNPI